MRYKLKVYMLAVKSKFHTNKKGFSPCYHVCLFCKFKADCAYGELRFERIGKH